MKRVIFIGALMLLALVVIAADGAYRRFHNEPGQSFLATYSDAGDTAMVFKVNKFTARDSFPYSDTIHGFGGDSVAKWVSPLQVRRVEVDTPGDTSATLTCTLDCGTNKYGFEYIVPEYEGTVYDSISRDVADSVNAVSGFADTVTAEDSVGYVKLISNFAMDHLEGDARWTLALGSGLTEIDSTFTTIAMVCDSMVATINAIDSLAHHITAANSGDSIYTLTSDKKGVAFTIGIADTAQDTATVTPNKTSVTTDTAVIGIGEVAGWNSMRAVAIIEPSATSGHGIGLDDSGYIWLYTYYINNADRVLMDSTAVAGLPCTLSTAVDATVGDTLLRNYLEWKFKIYDSTTDTNATISYPFRYSVMVK